MIARVEDPKKVPVCECGATPPYWRKRREGCQYLTLNVTTLDWEETHCADNPDEYICGECDEHASEDNQELLEAIY